MTSLVLRLTGPLQAWGSSSRFVRRGTERAPTKSGVIGMLAAARGMRRTDDLTEFLGMRFGVRIDQPGTVLQDFQTARTLDGSRVMPLSYRHYLADAVFVAAVEGDEGLISGLDDALRAPVFPLYLGRRSCPPVLPVSLGLRDKPAVEALRSEEWMAAAWYRRKTRQSPVRLEIIRDAESGDGHSETMRDEPLSFDPTRREYGWRSVVREWISVENPDFAPANGRFEEDHDPMTVLGG
ncbi:MAG: type I-E CRISPR-associated protein Cas5/CasD [Coriobacteriia bacterium]|nr:type I-E CRISPR-associated protein Cas5/CasD [Coriobacteriia bacterium]